MPVKKFHDISQMKRSAYRVGSPELLAVTRSTWALSDKICPLRFPPGVYKHRSIEDAQALRKEWERANAEAQQARIRAKPVGGP